MTTPAPSRAREGMQLGRYRLRHKLAEGGMASVYLAQLEAAAGFERWVAAKVVHPQMAQDRAFATMLLDEARLAARIHHPNVCAVLDFGEQDRFLYLIMEYLHGETLSAAVRRGWGEEKQFPSWLATRVIADSARGLHAAHEQTDAKGELLGLVHRDVSPQNIVILYDGMSKVVDFGIARAKGRLTVTRKGEVKGKLAYISPEQVTHQNEVDRRADIWSLGVVLWEATVGERLFRGENSAETLKKVVTAEITPPSERRPGYPAALETIVMRALARQRDDRYATAADMADDLDTFLHGLTTPGGHADVARWMREHFDDRLLVRQALLHAGSDGEGDDLSVDDLQSESSLGSHIYSEQQESGARIRRRPLPAPKPIEKPFRSDPPTTRIKPFSSRPPQPAVDVDEALGQMQRSRRIFLGITMLLLAAAGFALTWFIMGWPWPPQF